MASRQAPGEELCSIHDQIEFLVKLLETLNASDVEKARKTVADRLSVLGTHSANIRREATPTAAREGSYKSAKEDIDGKDGPFPGVRMHTESESGSITDGDAASSPGAVINRRKRSSMLLHNSPSSLDARRGLQRRGTLEPGGGSKTLDAESFQELGWKTAASSGQGSRTPQPSKRVSINFGARSGKLKRRATALLDKGEVSTVWSSRVHEKQEKSPREEDEEHSASDREISPLAVEIRLDKTDGEATEHAGVSESASGGDEDALDMRSVPSRTSSQSSSHQKPVALKRTQSNVVKSSSLTPKGNGFLTARESLSVPEPVRRYLSLSHEELALERSEEDEARFRNVFDEIMRTERDFVRDLKIIDELFRLPLENKKLITPSESMVLFGGLNPILQVNTEFLRQLEYISEQMHFMDKIKTSKDFTETTVCISVTSAESKRVRTFYVKGSTTGKEIVSKMISEEVAEFTDEIQQQKLAKYASWQLFDKASGVALPETLPVAKSMGYNGKKLRVTFSKPVSGKNVGECVLKMASYLKIYNEYCSRQANQVAMVDSLTKGSSDVRQFLKRQLRHKRCRNLDLCSFLIMPLQRLCKYPLLIKELVACTPENHVEYQSLKRAEDLIGESVMAVNNRRKQLDELCFVRDLQNSLDGRKTGFSLAVPGRKFITRGPCTAHHSLKKYDKVQAAVYFIFSDMIMITSEAVEDRYQLISYCMLKDAYIMTIPGDAFGLRLVNVDKKSRQTLIISSPNVDHVVETIQHQILRCAYDHWSFTRLQSNKPGLPFDQWNDTYGRMLFENAPVK